MKRITIINPNFYNIIIQIRGKKYLYYSNSFLIIISVRCGGEGDDDGGHVGGEFGEDAAAATVGGLTEGMKRSAACSGVSRSCSMGMRTST